MQKLYDKFKTLDVEILSVHREEREGVEGLKKTIRMTGIKFPPVLDFKNKETAPYSQGAFFTYVIDKSGTIRAILPGTTYERPTGEKILETFKKCVANK